jgi:hypothetical protein
VLVCILLGWSRPSFFLGRVWPIRKKILQKLFKKNLWFSANLLLHFDQYRFVFLYCKDTNPVLKYPIFIKTLKNKNKNVLFSCIRPSLSKIKKNKKKSYCIFIQQRKFQKYVLTCILALITSLLKSRELGQYFKNSKKINFVFF